MNTTATKAGELHVTLRRLNIRDLPDIVAIEEDSFEFPFSKADFVEAFLDRSRFGMVAGHDARAVGFAVCKLDGNSLTIEQVAVAAEWRRQRVGTLLLQRSVCAAEMLGCEQIWASVREYNIAGQVFFRSCGFNAAAVRLRVRWQQPVLDPRGNR